MIPRHLPRVVFEAKVPPPWFESQAAPVPLGDLVLLSCGWASDREVDGDRATALVALDGRSGAERFRLEVPVRRPAATEGQAGLAAPSESERFVVPVYQWDDSLSVYLLDATGRIEREDALGDETRMVALGLRGGDSGIKLFLAAPAIDRDRYFVSWIYRQRRSHVMCRELASGGPCWASETWLAGAANGLAVTETDAPRLGHRLRGAELVVRRGASGDEVWRLPGEEAAEAPHDPRPPLRTIAGVFGDTLVVVDREAAREAWLERERDVLERAAASSDPDPDFDALERAWDQEHGDRLSERLVGYDLSDGRVRWALTAKEIGSVAGSRDVVAAVERDRRGRVWLVRVEPGGVPSRSQLSGEGAADRDLPRVVAVDEELVLWATDHELVLEAPLGRSLWRVPLPAPCLVPRPRVRDRRLGGASIAVSGGSIWLRGDSRVWGLR